MDYKINIGSSLNPVEKLVNRTDTPSALLREMNLDFNNGTVSLDGRVLSNDELNQTVEELRIGNNSYLTISTKQNSGI